MKDTRLPDLGEVTTEFKKDKKLTDHSEIITDCSKDTKLSDHAEIITDHRNGMILHEGPRQIITK